MPAFSSRARIRMYSRRQLTFIDERFNAGIHLAVLKWASKKKNFCNEIEASEHLDLQQLCLTHSFRQKLQSLKVPLADHVALCARAITMSNIISYE